MRQEYDADAVLRCLLAGFIHQVARRNSTSQYHTLLGEAATIGQTCAHASGVSWPDWVLYNACTSVEGLAASLRTITVISVEDLPERLEPLLTSLPPMDARYYYLQELRDRRNRLQSCL